jgi:hypothetical protein
MSPEGRERAFTSTIAILALVVSGLGFYRSYIYKDQSLDLTVTEVSYATNAGGLYMTVAFSNAGNRDAALLRVEPALWSGHGKANPEWVALNRKVAPSIPLANPRLPTVVRGGGLELVTLSAQLEPDEAEAATTTTPGMAYLGLRVATMNSDGNLYFVQHAVARLTLDDGKIVGAEPTIHRTLSGFRSLSGAPPGDQLQSNEKTPFVWADRHY